MGEIFSSWRRIGVSFRMATIGLLSLSLALQLSAVSVSQWRFWYRLQAAEEHTSIPFRWGAGYYHYYWDIGQSPILVQVDDLYQVIRLNVFGEQRYRLTARPTACTPVRCPSNPADNYPINTMAFWWADTWHPLLGSKARDALAGTLGIIALGSLAVLIWCVSGAEGEQLAARRELRLEAEPT
jgi:hypothetical protein